MLAGGGCCSAGRARSVWLAAVCTCPAGVTGTREKIGTVAMFTSTRRVEAGSRGKAVCSSRGLLTTMVCPTSQAGMHRHVPDCRLMKGR